ncbi:beta-ketoacyl-[acyl-carrier-protein] synthase family protein [Marinilabiliaceae bacterium JC040]|nr:beta-ketoacyl-[acyl-carrier-protein] synthase family protein [Marinilabiliaceae bacterium JC040]
MEKRVVITGIGCYSCIGEDVQKVLESLQLGKSGIVNDLERKEYGYQSTLTGYVKKPKLKGLLDRRLRVGMAEQVEYAYLASKEAFDMALVGEEYLSENEVGILYGNDSSAKAVIESDKIVEEKRDTTLLGSGAIFQSMNSTANMNLSTVFKLKGINMTISAACASSSHAIGLGYMFIKSGMQDMILCGGCQETNYYSMASFDGLNAFSKRMDDPTKASRPFDKDRDGLVPSGGAASIVIEEYEHAVKRGANIIAEIVGYGFSSNGEHISKASSDGSYRAMLKALEDAEIDASSIDYINAHATSTVQGDKNEAEAIKRIIGKNNPYVSSTKSMTGHECWMAGASEIVYTCLMMQNNFIAPNINFEEGDESSKGLNITNVKVDKELNYCLSNSFGFGGTNSALILKKL